MPSDTHTNPATKASDTQSEPVRETAVAPDPESTAKPFSVSFPEEFYNNPDFSDFTIHYGEYQEKTFYAHKAVLSSRSGWFKSAFTGSFPADWVGDTSTVTLGDDPEDIDFMLTWIYKDSLPPNVYYGGEELLLWENLIADIGLYQVADNYGLPELRKIASERFDDSLYEWLYYEAGLNSCLMTDLTLAKWDGILEKIYNGPADSTCETLIKKLASEFRDNAVIGYTAPWNFKGNLVPMLFSHEGYAPRFLYDFFKDIHPSHQSSPSK
ncbi:hypothetical protein DM02DRAFT_684815 [Periconia macrospinosa]|uniref:BTB domain-containing protein n=1 Tax=Periconia macrospinosa TaxID=97972 RepID=A0A2V1DHI2_9PLEO|nr:hypothetical protein DM02DRAFT_684815 [Periconia macrospinosa]